MGPRWAGVPLRLVGLVGVVAKILGVLVLPGMRGIASQRTIEWTEAASATFGYAFGALLLALIVFGSFELSRARGLVVMTRGGAVAVSGLVVALASPSVFQRLHTAAALGLGFVASLVAIIATTTTLRKAHTRAVGALLLLLAVAGTLRPVAWELTSVASDHANVAMYHWGRIVMTIAVALQAIAASLAAAWLGTRSAVRGRIFANIAILLACGVTFVAARDTGEPLSMAAAVLRGSLAEATNPPVAYGLASVTVFLVPATTLLALVALVQRAQPPAVLTALALALLSQGMLDVPLHALSLVAAAHWALLAAGDERSAWDARLLAREDDAPLRK
jgi:hypothetical protein